MRTKVAYSQLPPSLSLEISEKDFLRALSVDNGQTLIVWKKNNDTKRQQELQFSIEEGRLLSRTERLSLLPKPERFVLPEDGVEVIKGARLEQATDVRYETYAIYLAGTQSKISTCEQIYFSLDIIDIRVIVRSALEKISFPSLYLSWPERDRVDYWVAALYRSRRQLGELGAAGDAAFSPQLVENMRSIDKNIESILSAILTRLAEVESEVPAEIIKSFNERTGRVVR